MRTIPPDFNYIGCFLTFACPYDCWFCINRESFLSPRPIRPGAEWVAFINQFDGDVPFTLQGGEPTCHPDFHQIVNETKPPINLLTNLSFDVDKFIATVDPARFQRRVPSCTSRSRPWPRG